MKCNALKVQFINVCYPISMVIHCGPRKKLPISRILPEQVDLCLQEHPYKLDEFDHFFGVSVFNALHIVGCFPKWLMSTDSKLLFKTWMLVLDE